MFDEHDFIQLRVGKIVIPIFECPIVTNYRTFIDELYKVLEFVEWYKEWY